jgi:hypothetical protein
MKSFSLTKTLFMEAVRCTKSLWLRINRPELAAPVDEVTSHLFDVGHRVEQIAHQLFPGGETISNGSPLAREIVLEKTNAAMKGKVPFIFEAGFQCDSCYCRTDIMEHTEIRGHWNLGEIKMCTKVKDEHPVDCAFQVHCIEQSGHRVNRVYLVHIRNEYEFDGEMDPKDFMKAADITNETRAALSKIPATIEHFREILEGECPEIRIGSHCKIPGKCSFYDYCHEKIPRASIFTLPFGHRVVPELLSAGVLLLKDIPPGYPLSKRQSAIARSAKTEKPVIDKQAIRLFLNSLKHPLYFLDFETVSPAIPAFRNTRPYERVAFQYSLHVQKTPAGTLIHHQFLPNNKNDPREQLIADLLDKLGTFGSVICWNAFFEKSVLKLLSERFPRFSGKINSVIGRIDDLMTPFREGNYVDANFEGSVSLKKVLPVLVPSLSYSGMSISQGDDASLRYELFIEGSTSQCEWDSVRKDLLAYCELDTRAMVEIHAFLQKAISKM